MAKVSKIDPEKIQKDIESYLNGQAGAIAEAIDALLEEESEIQVKADERKQMIREQIKPLNKLHEQATGKLYIPDGTPKRSGGGSSSGGRVRRTPDQLKSDAAAVVAFVKKNPGTGAGAIRSAVGIKLPPNLKEFVEKFGGVKLKTEGNKASTTYSV